MKTLSVFTIGLIFVFLLTACQTNAFVNDPWLDPVSEPIEIYADNILDNSDEELIEESFITDESLDSDQHSDTQSESTEDISDELITEQNPEELGHDDSVVEFCSVEDLTCE